MEAVVDTNVLVSAAISPQGAPADIIRARRSGAFIWVTSQPLLDELNRVIRSRRIKRYLSWTSADLDEFELQLMRQAKVVVPKERLAVVRIDPTDDRLIEAAVEADADYIVSGDRDLLEVHAYNKIEIVAPARFLAILASSA